MPFIITTFNFIVRPHQKTTFTPEPFEPPSYRLDDQERDLESWRLHSAKNIVDFNKKRPSLGLSSLIPYFPVFNGWLRYK